MNLAFGCRRVVFEWEGFGLESFRIYRSLSQIHILTKYGSCGLTSFLSDLNIPKIMFVSGWDFQKIQACSTSCIPLCSTNRIQKSKLVS